MDEEKAIITCSEIGKEKMLNELKRDLELFRVHFDTWFNESDLFKKGLVDKALNEMKAKGELYEKDDALWIRTSAYGDDKDRVIRKQDGQYTYFASDIAYHLDKYRRVSTGRLISGGLTITGTLTGFNLPLGPMAFHPGGSRCSLYSL
jgi:arginyl-tRNA synthetase